MAKRAAGETALSGRERVSCTVLFLLYLLGLPLLGPRLFSLAGRLLDTEISAAARSNLTFYLLSIAAAVLLAPYLERQASRFADRLAPALGTCCAALLLLYGGNELFFRLFRRFIALPGSLSDVPLAALFYGAAQSSLAVTLILAPLLEELFFRGLLFGGLRERSPAAAFAVSALAYALFHALAQTFSAGALPEAAALLPALRYLVPGLVFAWSFERSGTLVTPLLLHIVFNALAL